MKTSLKNPSSLRLVQIPIVNGIAACEATSAMGRTGNGRLGSSSTRGEACYILQFIIMAQVVKDAPLLSLIKWIGSLRNVLQGSHVKLLSMQKECQVLTELELQMVHRYVSLSFSTRNHRHLGFWSAQTSLNTQSLAIDPIPSKCPLPIRPPCLWQDTWKLTTTLRSVLACGCQDLADFSLRLWQTFKAFTIEAGLPSDAGSVSKGDLTLETLLDEKKTFDVAVKFEKLGVENASSGWTNPGKYAMFPT